MDSRLRTLRITVLERTFHETVLSDKLVKSLKRDGFVPKAPTVGKKFRRQGAQEMRDEAYLLVRRSDEF